ncbi:hypothetical protein E8D34_02510 [Nocardioides sp. GY 10113]|uniref:hypothetical protein n=1 Tax=Nocardioides sp. GY 10113 TaxID=2569761 RepID=UPI0010A930E4|nr:hypothetical protein [Nocardioides sp. GY 10113]TIC88578.1 hypothetical protein E8D34_02510 [Nocardioides sp. GY 10113]
MLDPTTIARPPAGDSPDRPGASPRPVTSADLVLVIGAAMVAAQAALRAWVLHASYFFGDDLRLMVDAHERPLSVAYLLDPHQGHLAPGTRLLAWLVTASGPLDWTLAATLTVLAQLLASAACLWMLLVLLGPRWRALVALAIYLVVALAALGTTSWAASTALLVAQAASFAAVASWVRYLRRRRPRDLALTVVAVLLGLAVSVWATLVLPVLCLVAAALLSRRWSRSRLVGRTLRYWPVALAVAAIGAAAAIGADGADGTDGTGGTRGANGIWSRVQQASPWPHDNASRAYVNRLRADLDAREETVDLASQVVPPAVLPADGAPQHRTEALVPLVSENAQFPTSTDELSVITDAGAVVPAAIGGGPRGEGRPEGECGWQITDRPVTIRLDAPAREGQWARFGYLSAGSSPVLVTGGGEQVQASLADGLNSLYLRVPAATRSLTVGGLDPGANLCVDSVEVGTPTPLEAP